MGTLRDIALILLSLELCLGALVGLAALAVANYGLLRLRWWRTLPEWFRAVRTVVLRGRDVVERLARISTAPVYRVESAGAGVRRVVEELVGKRRQDEGGGES